MAMQPAPDLTLEGLVHDLRNPLTTMATTLQLAQNRLTEEADGDVRPLLQNVYTGSQD